ncbi:MAG: phenylacetate--CoA ligase family protein [Rhodospirillales bacterium]
MVRRNPPRAKRKKARRAAPSPGDAKGAKKATPVPKSGRTGIGWPALPSHADAQLLALQYQFEESQWWPAETLLEHQLRQVEILLAHAARTVAFYGTRLEVLRGLRKGELTLDAVRRIPILRRSDIQEAGAALVSRRLPKDHGRTSDIRTSGSTGRPITIKGTAITGMFFRASSLRYHVWHGRDFSAKTASIHTLRGAAAKAAEARKSVGWVPGYDSGPLVLFDVSRPVAEQFDWLRRQNPDYLVTHPSNLRALVRHCQASGGRPGRLREVFTLGEVLDPGVRAACEKVWRVPVVDAYSSQEIGMIALQCPEHPHYHVQAENVLVEILDKDGKPCAPGEAGRLVVTALHNFATPLIRYEIGDYAEAGEPCSCGRGLPVLSRILGRVRNMLTLPNGDQLWPSFPSELFLAIAPVRQFQLVQRRLDEIEVRLAVEGTLSGEQEERLREALDTRLGHPFNYRFTYVDEIPRSASGKYEDFRVELDP